MESQITLDVCVRVHAFSIILALLTKSSKNEAACLVIQTLETMLVWPQHSSHPPFKIHSFQSWHRKPNFNDTVDWFSFLTRVSATFYVCAEACSASFLPPFSAHIFKLLPFFHPPLFLSLSLHLSQYCWLVSPGIVPALIWSSETIAKTNTQPRLPLHTHTHAHTHIHLEALITPVCQR